MNRSVLSELEMLVTELVDVGYHTSGEMVDKPYRKETIDTFSKLLQYVRGGSWTPVDTSKFIAQNFMVGQTNLAEVWSQRYPSKPIKADSTMRTQWQKVNRYLSNILPEDLTDIFINEDDVRLSELSESIDALYFNDTRVEGVLGEQLVTELESLPMSTVKYSVEDCLTEISVLKRLSAQTYKDIMSTCDQNKLAYAFHVLTRPSNIAGKVNQNRLDFIKAFVSSDSEATSLFKSVLEDYIKGVKVSDEDMMVNPEVLYAFHDISTKEGIEGVLSQFSKEDVAYAVSELKKGNELYLEVLKNGRHLDDSEAEED